LLRKHREILRVYFFAAPVHGSLLLFIQASLHHETKPTDLRSKADRQYSHRGIRQKSA